jgi:hypothetical protein
VLPLPPVFVKFLGAFWAFVAMLAVSYCDGNPGAPPVPTPTATPSVTPVAACPQQPGQSQPPPQSGLQTAPLTVTGNGRSETLAVELALTTAQHTIGLMSRPRLPESAGMLFRFKSDRSGGFWMHNTLIPLSIAYLDADGRVLAIRDGRPCDDTVLTPGVVYRNVLEVNQGWFERHGFGIGSIVLFPEGLPAAQ